MYGQVNLTSLINSAIAEISDNRQLIGIFLAIVVPVGTLAGYIGPQSGSSFGMRWGFQVDGGTLAQSPLVAFAAFVVEIIATYWLYAGMTRRNIAPGFDRILPFVGVYILSSIGIAIGLVFLIVPGVILAIRWIAVLPSLLDGQDGAMESFSESWRMTDGYSWSIFGAAIVLGVGAAILAGMVSGVGTYAAVGLGLLASFFGAAAENLAAVVFVAFAVGAYRLLRGDDESLAQVFE